jgi:predicted DNA-binding transcriptional regulator YafY
MAKKQRSDADRRVRQCERLGRLLRLLHLIMGKGRWDAGTLAEELECSRRTVYRLLQSLSMAGVPWYFDEGIRAYRVRPGFKFPGIEPSSQREVASETLPTELDQITEKLISDGEAFADTLRKFLDTLRESRRPDGG